MKYGFEREFFVKASGKFVLCPAVMPQDDCGYLAESRGVPTTDPLTAAFLLLAEEYKLKAQAKRNRVVLVNLDTAVLPPELLRDALRRHGKSPMPVERGNMYGLDYPSDDKFQRAGLHVHFSNETLLEINITDSQGNKHYKSTSTSGFIDVPRIIRTLDGAFKKEIEQAERIAGSYELKNYGFEYRSLPASVDVRRVAEVIKEIA